MYAVTPVKRPLPFAPGTSNLNGILSDGNTVAWYRPGVGVTGTLTATAWANQMGAAPSLTTGVAPIYLPYSGAKYGYITPPIGNYFGTPSAAWMALNKSEIQADIEITDVATAGVFYEQFNATGNQLSWALIYVNTGIFRATISTDGVATTDLNSTAHGLSSGQRAILKWKRDGADGSFSFAVSTNNGATFTAIGSGTGATGSLFASTAVLSVGRATSNNTLPTFKVYRVRAWTGGYSDAGGTLQSEFNAADWSETMTNGATQASSTTGEVWTLNNTAIATPAAIVANPFIVTNESTMWLRSTYTANQPRTYYLVGYDPVWAAGKYILDGTTANKLGLSKTTGTPKLSLNAGAAAAENAGFTLRAKHILTVVLNGASSSTTIDGGTPVTGDPGAGNPGGLTIGANGGVPTAGTFGGFWFSEIIDRSGADSANTQTQIVRVLGRAHGITV